METGALRNNPQLVNIQIVLLAERKDLFFVCQLHFPCHRGIIQNDKGSWRKLAERRLYRFDPEPDLDNANGGTEERG